MNEWEEPLCQVKQYILYLSHKCIYHKLHLWPSLDSSHLYAAGRNTCSALESCLKYKGIKVNVAKINHFSNLRPHLVAFCQKILNSWSTAKPNVLLLYFCVFVWYLLINFLPVYFTSKGVFSSNFYSVVFFTKCFSLHYGLSELEGILQTGGTPSDTVWYW